jgi:hypothetical protein
MNGEPEPSGRRPSSPDEHPQGAHEKDGALITEPVHIETGRAQKLPGPCRDSGRKNHLGSVGRDEAGYVRARFGCTPVLITPELASQSYAPPAAFRET